MLVSTEKKHQSHKVEVLKNSTVILISTSQVKFWIRELNLLEIFLLNPAGLLNIIDAAQKLLKQAFSTLACRSVCWTIRVYHDLNDWYMFTTAQQAPMWKYRLLVQLGFWRSTLMINAKCVALWYSCNLLRISSAFWSTARHRIRLFASYPACCQDYTIFHFIRKLN